MLEMALDQVAADYPDRALLLATLCLELTYGSSLEQRKQLADEALALAHASADPTVMVRVLNSVLFPLRVPELLDWSMKRSAEALQLAERLGDPVQLFWAAHGRNGTAAWAKDIDEMDRCAIIRNQCADRLDQPMFDWICCYMDCLRAQISGDIDTAWHLAEQAQTIATHVGEPDATTFFEVEAVTIMHQQGTLSEATVPIEDRLAQDGEVNVSSASSWLALAYGQGDRIDDSRRVLEAVVSVVLLEPRDPEWLSMLARYAEIATLCEHRAISQILFDLLAPWAGQMTIANFTTEGPVDHYLATLAMTLGNFDVADEYFARADAFNRRNRAKFFDARTKLWWARMLIARNDAGDIDRARAMLTTAHTVAQAHGYGDVERRAADTLRIVRSATA